jgi:hypothetical protein
LLLIGLDWAVPDFSTLSRRQKTLQVNIPYRGSDGPLHLLADIEPLRRHWFEPNGEACCPSCSTRSRPIRRSPVLPPTAPSTPASATASGAYAAPSGATVPLRTIAARGAVAIIPPRKNAKAWKPETAGAVARHEILRISKRVGRTIWPPSCGHDSRSRAEM